ncbi:MucR family transcriptional regulator [Sphingomonas sp.]|uniref:MucR family transcriptional regulator n=1 Tax=Sphingomonas sp. TaxID=28214 RepID=UPI002FC5EC6B
MLTLTADIVAAHVTNNRVGVGDLAQLIDNVHAALEGLGAEVPVAPIEQVPAVSVKASIKPDFIVCLEDGKKLKMLKRHLATDHQMTPLEYRAKWKLSADYPMVAPNYSEARRGLAHKIGLGRKRSETPSTKPSEKATKPRQLKLRSAEPETTPPEA